MMLNIDHLNISYNHTPAVQDLSLAVGAGQIVGIAGESGSLQGFWGKKEKLLPVISGLKTDSCSCLEKKKWKKSEEKIFP